jgi:hypothetical protein
VLAVPGVDDAVAAVVSAGAVVAPASVPVGAGGAVASGSVAGAESVPGVRALVLDALVLVALVLVALVLVANVTDGPAGIGSLSSPHAASVTMPATAATAAREMTRGLIGRHRRGRVLPARR